MPLGKSGQCSKVIIGVGIAVLVYTGLSVPSKQIDHRIQTIKVSSDTEKCLSKSALGLVSGKEFSDEVWNLQAAGNTTEVVGTTVWRPSKFSELCATGVNLNASIHAPPLYNSKDRPRGLRLVMLGDSVTRFQSIMLMHFIRTGYWIHDSMQPTFLRAESFGEMNEGWLALYHALDLRFGNDHLICDCIRGPVREKHLVENLFYYDKGCLDNSVSFFLKFGSSGFRGYQNTSDINGWFHDSSLIEEGPKQILPDSQDAQGNSFTWRYMTYEPFLRNVVATLQPRPRVVVINEGLWPDVSLLEEAVVIRDTIHDLGMVSVYRTTTKTKGGESRAPHDKLLCETFDYCLQMDWTACLEKHDYYDDVHFLAYPNLRFVEQLLNLLEEMG